MTDDRPNDPSSPQGASPASPTPQGDPTPGSSPYDQTSPWSSPPPAPTHEQAPPPTPYSQQQPYGQGSQPPSQQPPYSQQPYGQPGAPYQGGYQGAPQAHGAYAPEPVAKARSSATLWLILNIVSVVFCGNLPGIAGAIYAGLAMGRVDTDLADAQKKTRLSKIWFFAGLVLAALVIIGGLIAFLVVANNTSPHDFGTPTDI